MSLFSLIAALLLEQLHPLASRAFPHSWLNGYTQFFQHHFNAGERKQGQLAWLIAVLLPLSASAALYWLLYRAHPVFAWAFCVLVLYVTLGFRQFSHYFTDIHQALRDGDLEKSRALLSGWRGAPSHELSPGEVARVAIEEALLASHHHVFGVTAWFVITMLLGLGPSGAVLYRLAFFLNARWGRQDDADLCAFGAFAHQAYRWLEWLPLRLTAATFAIVGDFEDTVYCWRTQAQSWPDPEAGIVLASGAGALGVRLGQHIPQGGLPLDRPEMGIGEEADADFMQSTVGLVWRALVFWMILLLLLGLASLAGG
ncbi:MAG: adenosylcobinamide-phosphate synthase [Gallionellaceae bacterium]|nr:MAG: adenosylcobinamide-phosphate synthase [Gallionellaceae bacterium]